MYSLVMIVSGCMTKSAEMVPLKFSALFLHKYDNERYLDTL